MHIPTSVLEGCNKSFIAADEKREKVAFFNGAFLLMFSPTSSSVSQFSMPLVTNGLAKLYITPKNVLDSASQMEKGASVSGVLSNL